MQELHSLAFQRARGYPVTLGPPPPVKCPRCESTNTKFCYYNNYNLSQPRHFCKSCRRYWTRGGLLRNVPVGGGTRKSKSKSKPKSKKVEANPYINPNPNPDDSYPDHCGESIAVASSSESEVRQVTVQNPGFGFPDSEAGNEFPDLHGNGSGSLFDVTGSVPYWNHCSWADADPSALYLS